MSRTASSTASSSGATSPSTGGRSSGRPRCRRASSRRTASMGSAMPLILMPGPANANPRGQTGRMRIRPLALAAVLLAAACSSDKPAAPPATPPETASAPASSPAGTGFAAQDWPMYHRTPDRAGVEPAMPSGGTPKLAQSLKLDGAVYASPLVVRGLTVVATENDTVYAFNGQYRQVWKRTLGSPSPAEERQCGDIDPLGITGTPIFDRTSGKI